MFMMNKAFSFVIVCLMAFATAGCNTGNDFIRLEGSALGTTYAITLKTPPGAPSGFRALAEQTVTAVLQNINNSLSIYNNHSLISRINRNLTQETDSLFRIVFEKAVEISDLTDGAFDISAAPLFDLWGFGFERKDNVRTEHIDELLPYTGMDKFRLVGTLMFKEDPRGSLSMNAIAKGFACDLMAREFTLLGVTDMLVEIGGEIVCKGLNPGKEPWRIGVDSPVDGNVHPGEHIEVVIRLTDKSLATSGNYRNYYIRDGEKYAHIIDPRSGYPVNHNLLSATVIADDCMTADAFATAFMVMGLEASKSYLQDHPGLGAFLIYDEKGKFSTFATDNIITDL